jgi:hypothetical protein
MCEASAEVEAGLAARNDQENARASDAVTGPGNAAARTPLPQPPKTNQNVPSSSAKDRLERDSCISNFLKDGIAAVQYTPALQKW